jgi:hypothetical protein
MAGSIDNFLYSALYIIDAHRDIAVEAFTCLLVFKNFFSFGLTFSAYDWLSTAGTYKTFMIISSIQVAICFLTVPMCEYFLRWDLILEADFSCRYLGEEEQEFLPSS